MDTRFTGVARGVGTANILGRIHLALLTLSTEVFEIAFTVLDCADRSYDILLGLDMLRKHQAMIDLKDNCLRIGEISVPFLDEKDIPASIRDKKEISEEKSGTKPLHPAQDDVIGSSSNNATDSAASAQAATTVDSQVPPPVDDAAVNRIVELGFSKTEAEAALRACGGNIEHAIQMLAEMKFERWSITLYHVLTIVHGSRMEEINISR